MGKLNVTVTGKACQPWSLQSPHEHTYTDNSMFPDGSVNKASNLCRNPDDEEPGGPWCYTQEPGTRWEYCDVPKCGELLYIIVCEDNNATCNCYHELVSHPIFTS